MKADGRSAGGACKVLQKVHVGWAAGLALVFATYLHAQEAAPRERWFSSDQANRGATVFAAHCAACHTPGQAADLMLERGAALPLGDYHARLSQLMPPQSAVRPDPQGYLDVIAFLARTAGLPPGPTEARAADQTWRQAQLMPKVIARTPVTATAADFSWPAWRGDLAGTGHSLADQIDRYNVAQLKVAWRWSGANFGPAPELRNITTPLMVDGVLFATAGVTRNVVALDAATGETLWMWRPQEPQSRFDNAPRKGAGRGVAYWSGGGARIFTVTPGFQLVALDARSGVPVAGFGRGGKVDLMEGLRGAPAQGLPDIGSQSPPLVIGDVVVVGPAHRVSLRPRSSANVKGDVRGFDARTGRLLWTFRTIPARGDPGYETWAAGTAERAGNGGVWAPMSADPRTGAIFLPVEAGTSDLYGGERLGANLHTSSLVSLDARTGRLRWAQQLVHHDIWDLDVPAQPILADIPTSQGIKRTVAQVTKQGFVYVFDRDTGEPLWPIEERPVPASDVPGEQAWPTQPMPTRPAPFDRQGVTVDSLIDFNPELRAEAIAALKPYRLGGFMAPASLQDAPDSTHGTLALPGVLGGANWEGGVYDPETGLLYVPSMTQPSMLALAPGPEGSGIRYVSAGGRVPTVRGLPIVKPPYGRITAIDLKSGDHAWMIANADTPRAIREHTDLRGLDLPRTGVPSRAGLLVTRTLLFAGEGEGGSPILRAHDKATSQILAEIPLPASQVGMPMTYVWRGRQYIVLAVGDGAQPAEIVALALPE